MPGATLRRCESGRTADALAMIFCRLRREDNVPPKSYYSGDDAAVPVAMFARIGQMTRLIWGQGRFAPWSHGRYGCGSFVYEVDGVRWAADGAGQL